jgi:hypothetical protein
LSQFRRIVLLLAATVAVMYGVDKGGHSLFNGRDLTGWDGNPACWSVENGVIVGRTTVPDQLPYNQFLIWRGGQVGDFELTAVIRESGNNSGIQYRSSEFNDVGRWSVGGYQLDIHPLQPNNGQLYEERGRRLLGRNGHSVVIDPAGKKWLVGSAEPLPTEVGEWNEYKIIARGNHVIHLINGRKVFELRDYEADKRALNGLLAIQLHRGPPMTVEIKQIILKELPPFAPDRFDPKLIPAGSSLVPVPIPTQ